MSSPYKSSSITTRPSLWFVLALVTGGMISTVQWQHAQALLLAGGFASISAFFLVLSAYFLGRRGTPLGREKNLITLGLDNSPDGYLVAGKKGNYLYSNPNFHKLLSFTGSADLARRAVSIDAIIEALDGTGAEQVASLKSGLLNGSSGLSTWIVFLSR